MGWSTFLGWWSSWPEWVYGALGTLLATGVGAALALWGSLLLYRRESDAQYQGMLTDSIARIVEEAARYEGAWLEYERVSGLAWQQVMLNRGRTAATDPIRSAPNVWEFVALVQSAALRATGNDRNPLLHVSEIAGAIPKLLPATQVAFMRRLADKLFVWVSTEQRLEDLIEPLWREVHVALQASIEAIKEETVRERAAEGD